MVQGAIATAAHLPGRGRSSQNWGPSNAAKGQDGPVFWAHNKQPEEDRDEAAR